MHLQMCTNAHIVVGMDIMDSIENIEKIASDLGIEMKNLYADAGIALSTRTRWRNGSTSPNTSTISRLEKVITKKNKTRTPVKPISSKVNHELTSR